MLETANIVHIGLDDTDSPYGLCTTYTGSILLLELLRRRIPLVDYPYLIRLNPNVPFKTRGNGAVSLHFRCEDGAVDEIEEVIEGVLEAYSEKHAKTDPTAVIVRGPAKELRTVYWRALAELLTPSYVENILRKLDARVIGGRKARGIVGAAASVGAYRLEVYTYELLLYTTPGTPKPVDKMEDDVVELDRLLRPLTFANIDYASSRVLATPRGPDPVIAGIRSANPIILSSVARRLAEKWKAAFSVVFKTNQATGCHLSTVKNIGELRPYDSTVVRGRVVGPPTVLKGGHVIFKLVDATGEVTCAVYSETGLQKLAKLLRDGDSIEVGGGVQPRSHGLTLNAEYLRILETPPLVKLENPRCPRCGRRLKSSGKGKGFKCEVCGFKTTSSEKIEVKIPRFLDPGLYLQRPLAYRHLSPPAEVLGTTPLPAPPIPELVVWSHPA